MIRLARYIENELDQNLILFAQAETRLMASCNYIDFVLQDTSLVQLTEEEQNYIHKVRESYANLQSLTEKITLEIQKYKENYCEAFADEFAD